MKVIFNSILKSMKKAVKWYLMMAAQNGYMMYNTGSYPTKDYFYIGREKNKKENVK